MNERRYLPKVFINIYLRSFETVRTHKYGPRTLSLTFGRTQFWSAVIDFGSRVFFFRMAPSVDGERARQLANTLLGAKDGGRHHQQRALVLTSLRRTKRRCA